MARRVRRVPRVRTTSPLRRLAPAAALGVVLGVALLSRGAAAEEAKKTYVFGTHPARTNVTFTSEADLETIHGTVRAISGSVAHDAAGSTATGKLVVKVADLRTGIDLRDEHLRSATWLDADKFPDITFDLGKAVPAPPKEGVDKNAWDYDGKLTIRGVTKPWKGRATVRFIPASVAGPANLGDGDWVRVKTEFDVPIEDFGVKIPEGIGPKVSKVWKVAIDLYGTTEPPKK